MEKKSNQNKFMSAICVFVAFWGLLEGFQGVSVWLMSSLYIDSTIPKITSGKWNSIFRNFQKKGNLARYIPKYLEISQRDFPFHLIFLLQHPEFLVEWFAFQISTISGFSGNFPEKSRYHSSLFWNFRNFWLIGKCSRRNFRFLRFWKLRNFPG